MSRLSSAFEAAPAPDSMLAALEESYVEISFLARAAIRLCHDPKPGDPDSNMNSDVEPPPCIDYHLIYAIINVCRSSFDKREVKCFDYLIDARKFYYKSHLFFQTAFHGLQDVQAYGVVLEQERARLEQSGSECAKELEKNKIATRKNNDDLFCAYMEVIKRRESIDRVAVWFRDAKRVFLREELPKLIFLGKHVYRKVMLVHGRISDSSDYPTD